MSRRQSINPRQKQKILERDNFKCVSCGASGDFNCLEVDHIIPIVNGGYNNESNLQTLCYRCNMAKRFGKDISNKYFLDLNPLDRLELVKERLKLYKNLTYAEFKVVFTQDELFKRLRLDLLYLNDLFFEISNLKRETCLKNNKYKEQRNVLLNIIRDLKDIPLQELEKWLHIHNFNISFQQISKICSKIEEKDKIWG